MRKIVFLLVFVLLGVAMAAFAQQDVSRQAAEALANGDYPRAITLYEEITKGDAHNAVSWERLGLSYLLGGKYSLAVPALERALQEGFQGRNGKYNLACAYARLGRKDDSIRLLQIWRSKAGLELLRSAQTTICRACATTLVLCPWPNKQSSLRNPAVTLTSILNFANWIFG